MADRISPAQRSRVMSRIRAKHTRPELSVRRAVRGLGYRTRLHVASLPGCPDIVVPSRRVVISVKGCFWHSHYCQRGRVPPGPYWCRKLLLNRRRDERNEQRLRRMGWSILSVWECQITRWGMARLQCRIGRHLLWVAERPAGLRRYADTGVKRQLAR